MKVTVEGFDESGGLSRALLEAGEGMTEGGEVAAELLRVVSEGGGMGLQREPGEECTGRGGQARAAGGEQLLLAEPVAAAYIGQQLRDGRRAGRPWSGLEHGADEVLLAHDAGIGLAAVEDLVVPLGSAVVDEAGKVGAGNADSGAELPEHPVGGEPGQRLALEQELGRPGRREEALSAQEIARRWERVNRYAGALANEPEEDARHGAGAITPLVEGMLSAGALGSGFGYSGSTGAARGVGNLPTLQGLEEGFRRIRLG